MAKAKPQPPPKAKKPQPPSKARPASPPKRSPADDPALDAFTQGLAALQHKDWKKATDLLEKAVELADRSELRDRARQLLAAAHQKAAEGGKPAKSPEVDPYLQAVYEKNRGDFKAALEICRRGGRDQKDERFAYLAASIHAIEDRLDDAVQALTKAVELNPKNRIHAFHDPDFAELRANSDYRSLFGLS
jgi:tetratricopeptide (TPR) repeat protein